MTTVTTLKPQYQSIVVERDDARNLRFIGHCIAEANDSSDRACSNYSGSVGRSTALALYRTKGGKFVCERISYSQWQGEHTHYDGAVCETEAEVIDFFGQGRLARSIYREADIDNTEDVE